jgi:phosphate-selective porin
MRAQMAQKASRIDSLESELGDARAKAAAAQAKADAASAAVAAVPAQIAAAALTASAKPAIEITWDGDPRLSAKDGWSFKPRGRLQVDTAGVNAPAGLAGGANRSLGIATDTTAYKGGVYDRIRPKHPLGKGGMGAVQLNLRYDWLDLNSGAIIGGRQQVAGVSALWMPTDYVRFILNYGHLWLDNAAVSASAVTSYSADSMGLRAQFDF